MNREFIPVSRVRVWSCCLQTTRAWWVARRNDDRHPDWIDRLKISSRVTGELRVSFEPGPLEHEVVLQAGSAKSPSNARSSRLELVSEDPEASKPLGQGEASHR